MNPNQNDKMHPEDMRNMVIFFVLAAALYFGYSHFVMKPQNEAMLAKQAIEQQKEALGISDAPKIIPRAEALEAVTPSTAQRITIDNGALKGSFSSKGAAIDDVALSGYFQTLDKDENVVILSPRNTNFPRRVEYGWVAADKAVKTPEEDTVWAVKGNKTLTKDTPVTLVWNNGQGLTFERRLAIDEKFMLSVTQSVHNTGAKTVKLYPYGLITQQGQPPYFAGTWISHEGPIGYVGDELHDPSYKDMRKNGAQSYKSNQGWIGMTDKYWLMTLIPAQGEDVTYRFNYAGTRKDENNVGRFQTDYLGGAQEIAAGESIETQSRLFLGAKQVLTLEEYAKDGDIPRFDLAVNFGLLWFLSKPFFYILHYAGEMIGNFGLAIIFLTILIRGAVFPLTNMSYRSFAKMKKVAPQISDLREKHGEDKQKMQQELVKMYQKEGVNPMAGCFPILLQIPIFFALYKVLFITIEMRHAPFYGWIDDLSAADPTSIFNLFGLIPWDPPSVLMIGVWPCLMLLAMLMQKNLNPPPQDKLQKDIATWMPFMFAFIMSKFAAGLVIYWTFSAFIGVLQQIIIMKSMNVPIHLFGETSEEEIEEANKAEKEEEQAEEEEAVKDEKPKKISKPKPKKSKKKK